MKLRNIDIQIKYLALLLNLLVLKTVIPYLEFLFSALAFFSILIFISDKSIIIAVINNIIKNKRYFILYLIALIPFIYAFIITQDYTFLLIRELLVSTFFLYYLALTTIVLKSEKQCNFYIAIFKSQFIYITSIAAILGLGKYILEVFGVEISFLFSNNYYPAGTSLKMDHNFYALTIIIGFILVVEKILKKSNNSIILNIILIIYLINVIFTSSRRGIILIITLNILLLLLWIFRKKIPNLNINGTLNYFIFGPSIFLVFICGLFIYGNYSKKAGFDFKFKTASILNDYYSIFNSKTNINNVYTLLWRTEYSYDALENTPNKQNTNQFFLSNNILNYKSDSPPNLSHCNKTLNKLELKPGWKRWMSIRTEKIITDKLEIFRVEGYHPLSCIYMFIDIDTLSQSLYLSMNIKVEKWSKYQKVELRWDNDKSSFKIPKCFDDDKWHKIYLEAPVNYPKRIQLLIYPTGSSISDYGGFLINNITLSVNPIQEYNNIIEHELPNKMQINKREPVINKDYTINFGKHPWNITDNLIVDTINNNGISYLFSYTDSLEGTLYKEIVIPKSQFWQFSSDVCVIKAAKNLRIQIGNLNNGNYVKDVYETKTDKFQNGYNWENLSLYFYAEKNDTVRFALKHYNSDTTYQLVIWNNLILKSFNTDKNQRKDSVLSFNPNSIISIIDNIKNEEISNHISQDNSFVGPRLERWIFALSKFKNYSTLEKVFGSGFDYLNEYRKKFSENKDFDYPHNIFLSALLYSGMLGLFIYLLIILIAVGYFINCNKYILAFSYLLILSFVSFSSHTIFELPLLTGFIILSFIVKIYYKKTPLN